MTHKGLKNIYAVILAGGAGSRFWPLSRLDQPKQFIKLYNHKYSLIQETLQRVLRITNPERIIVVSNLLYRYQLKKHLTPFRFNPNNIISEPEGKNTALAIGVAAAWLNKISPDSVMVVLPSDHVIKNKRRFVFILKNGIEAAKKGYLVTLGIKPLYPHTGYGYIKATKTKIPFGERPFFVVDRFVEKPDIKRAKKFIENKNFYWNSGIFIWKSSVILEEFKESLPYLYKKLEYLKAGFNKEMLKKIYRDADSISVDDGILSKSRRVIMTVADIGWNDISSFQAFDDISKKDKNGNILNARSVDIDSRNITVLGNDRLIATIGLDNVVIVDTDDALLISRKDRTQDVRKIVLKMKEQKMGEYITHTTVVRPWGHYKVIKEGKGFKIKLVEVEPGKRISLQYHNFRSEHWVIVQGVAKITCSNKCMYAKRNESVFIPPKTVHRLENDSNVLLRIVEVQSGDYISEDDIIRLKDDYERITV